jgi:hypothetical protein
MYSAACGLLELRIGIQCESLQRKCGKLAAELADSDASCKCDSYHSSIYARVTFRLLCVCYNNVIVLCSSGAGGTCVHMDRCRCLFPALIRRLSKDGNPELRLVHVVYMGKQ